MATKPTTWKFVIAIADTNSSRCGARHPVGHACRRQAACFWRYDVMVRRTLAPWIAVLMGCANGGGDAAPATDAGRDAADARTDADNDIGQPDGNSIFPTEDATEDAPPPSCNGAALTAWSAPLPLSGVTGVVKTAAVTDPYVLPNGLALVFAAADASGKLRPHYVTRASRATPFSGGALIPGFEGTEWSGIDIGQPAAVRVDEMLFTTPINNGDIWVATRPGSTGTVLANRYTEPFINTADTDGSPTITADGERMVFARATGGHYELYEATRLTTSPGSPWVGVSALTSINNASYSVACPALSPDGLTLYFTTNAEAPGTLATTIFVTQRTSRTTAFGTPTPVPALTMSGKLNCPRSVTGDGCELYLSNNSTGTLSAYVARRTM